MGRKVAVILVVLIALSLSGCYADFSDRGEHHPVGGLQDHAFGLDFSYQAWEITTWNGKDCLFIHVVADEGEYRESLLDCED